LKENSDILRNVIASQGITQILIGYMVNKKNLNFVYSETYNILRNSFYAYYTNNPSFPFFLQSKFATNLLYLLANPIVIHKYRKNSLFGDIPWNLFCCLLGYSYSIFVKNMEFVRLLSKIFIVGSPYKLEQVKAFLLHMHGVHSSVKHPTGYVMTLKGFFRASQLLNRETKKSLSNWDDDICITFEDKSDAIKLKGYLYSTSGDLNFLKSEYKVTYGDVIKIFPYFICTNITAYSAIVDRIRSFHKSISGFTFPIVTSNIGASYYNDSFFRDEASGEIHLFSNSYTSSSFNFPSIDQQKFHEIIDLISKENESLKLDLNSFPPQLKLLHFFDKIKKFIFIDDYSHEVEKKEYFWIEEKEITAFWEKKNTD
jgi:hypothetical protein